MKKIYLTLFACLLLGACTPYNSENGRYAHASKGTVAEGDQLYDDVRSSYDTPPSVDASGRFINAWDRLHHNFKFHYALSNPNVKAELRWFVHNQAYLNRVAGRARPYLPYIIEEIEKRGLPGELALLPVLESAYDPYATSSARAVGLWQLMYGTAKLYGVKQTAAFNGRRDVRASTKAALDLLTRYNQEFNGDWLLTLAAYNAGDGTVLNAMQRNRRAGKPTDFWSLPLPRATQQFVPRLLALASIVAHPRAYDIELAAIPNQPYFKAVSVDKPMNLAAAAKIANIDISELHLLNPALTQARMDPSGPYELLLPVTKADAFAQRIAAGAAETVQVAEVNTDHPKRNITLAAHAKANRVIAYHVRPGDSLDKIARTHRVSVAHIKRWNRLSQHHLLKPGQVLTLYT